MKERQYIIIILKKSKFEVNINHCPEVWRSFEVEIEYNICSAFVAFIVFIQLSHAVHIKFMNSTHSQ